MGMLGSGFLYTYAGGAVSDATGYNPVSYGRLGLVACFVMSTVSSCLKAVITTWINDDVSIFCCGSWTIV